MPLLCTTTALACFYSATPAWNATAVDIAEDAIDPALVSLDGAQLGQITARVISVLIMFETRQASRLVADEGL